MFAILTVIVLFLLVLSAFGAFVATSPTIGFACCLAAWRMLKPVQQEMGDACVYRSTGAEDEHRFSYGD